MNVEAVCHGIERSAGPVSAAKILWQHHDKIPVGPPRRASAGGGYSGPMRYFFTIARRTAGPAAPQWARSARVWCLRTKRNAISVGCARAFIGALAHHVCGAKHICVPQRVVNCLVLTRSLGL